MPRGISVLAPPTNQFIFKKKGGAPAQIENARKAWQLYKTNPAFRSAWEGCTSDASCQAVMARFAGEIGATKVGKSTWTESPCTHLPEVECTTEAGCKWFSGKQKPGSKRSRCSGKPNATGRGTPECHGADPAHCPKGCEPVYYSATAGRKKGKGYCRGARDETPGVTLCGLFHNDPRCNKEPGCKLYKPTRWQKDNYPRGVCHALPGQAKKLQKFPRSELAERRAQLPAAAHAHFEEKAAAKPKRKSGKAKSGKAKTGKAKTTKTYDSYDSWDGYERRYNDYDGDLRGRRLRATTYDGGLFDSNNRRNSNTSSLAQRLRNLARRYDGSLNRYRAKTYDGNRYDSYDNYDSYDRY